MLVLCICFLATLYHVSVPVRTNWSFNLPGAVFALFCWIAGSYTLRWVLTVTAAESRSIYGPLAAPIAVLLWLYLLALAVLIGAAVNAAFDTVFPQKSTTPARLELVQRLRERIRASDDPDESTGPSVRDSIGRADPDSSALFHPSAWGSGSPSRSRAVAVVGARPAAPPGRCDPLRHRPASCTSTARATTTERPARLRPQLLDSFYYTTVTLSTTGYGDIAPDSEQARLVNALVITPARIAFLVLLIGTTLEVLASQGREMFRVARWRKKMGQHVVVVGYGTKGRSAIDTLINNGYRTATPSSSSTRARGDGGGQPRPARRSPATPRGAGCSARRRREGDHVIITTDRDDSNVLATLTVRQLNPDAWIVASVREHENVPLMRQSGANSVITSSDAVGRLLGLSSMSPMLGSVMEDLMTYGEGLEVAERDLLVTEVGKQPQRLPDQVIAVVRDEKVYRYFDPVVSLLARGDKLIVIRPAKELPWAPRPGTHGEDLADEEG